MTFSMRTIMETSQLSMDPWEASHSLAHLAMTRRSTQLLIYTKCLYS